MPYGGRQFRLVVYPPGTGDHDRRLLRVWQWWPCAGLLLALVTFACLGNRAGVLLSMIVAVAVFAMPLAWLRRRLRRQRRDVCVVHAEYLFGPGAAADLARCRRLISLSATLTQAERSLERGELRPVDFQRIWGDVHAEARMLRKVKQAA